MTTHEPILARLAALKNMTVNELKAEWQALFDAPAPNNSRTFLESRLAYRIQELTYGGLKPETIRRLEKLGETLTRKVETDMGRFAQGLEQRLVGLTDQEYLWELVPGAWNVYLDDDLAVIRPLLMAVCALGVSVAIDDFGTGFSSLSVLRHLPAQRLKIDRSFINELEDDDSIARMVISLGQSLGMRITAEGVETEAQRQALCALGCEEGQGWLFARALNEAELLAWLAERRQGR